MRPASLVQRVAGRFCALPALGAEGSSVDGGPAYLRGDGDHSRVISLIPNLEKFSIKMSIETL